MTFTQRQTQVAFLIARGYSNEEVGAELGITPRTAKAFSDLLRNRLGVEKRRQIPEAFLRKTGIDPYPRREVAA